MCGSNQAQSGMSVSFTIGASRTKQVGRNLNLKAPASIEGAIAAGALELEAFNCKMPERTIAFLCEVRKGRSAGASLQFGWWFQLLALSGLSLSHRRCLGFLRPC